MASRSLGTLTLDVVANIGGYTRGLDAAEREAKKRAAAIEKAFDGAFIAIGAGFAAMASAGAAALAVVNQQAEAIAGYQDLAEKIGDTAEAIASLQTAATVSGTSLETVATAINKLTNNLAEGGSAGQDAAKALEAIGISVEDFIKLSPVEKIDALAKSLNTFAEGPEKSVIAIQALGKAGAELLPFLNDLADGSERNIRLTQEQIEAADAYTKQVAHLQDQFNQFIQQQTSALIPTLSEVVKLMADLAKNEDLVSAASATLQAAVKAFLVVFQTIVVVASDVIFVFKQTGQEIGAIAAQLAALARFDMTGFRAISEAVKDDAQRARAELDKFQKQVMSVGQPAFVDDEIRRLQARSAAGQASAQRPRIQLPQFGSGGGAGGGRRSGGGGAEKDPFAQAQRYLENLQKQLERTRDLTVAEQALLDIQAGRLGKVSEAQKAAILDTARQIDAAKALEEQEKATAKALEEQARLREQLVKEGEAFTEQFLTPQEKYAKSIENVNRLYGEGVISLETATRAIQAYRKELEESNKTVEEFDEFTKNAIKGTQDSIAGFLENLASGGKKSFKEIANDFGQMLVKMAAQAVAADLTKKLFGGAGGGEGSGWVGALFSGVFGGARALGGPVLPNSMYQVNERGPEVFEAANGDQFLMTGRQGGRVNAGGATINIHQNFAPGTNKATTQQAAVQAGREINRSMARNGQR